MKFTFGIISDYANKERLDVILDSIRNLNIDDDFQILVVGPIGSYDLLPLEGEKETLTRFLYKDVTPLGHITKKKNIVAQEALYENIVFLHDYVKFEAGWYDWWADFGGDWDMAMNIIENANGSRFRDWCFWDKPNCPNTIREPWCPEGITFQGRPQLAPYDATNTQHMYVSGTYFLAKKQFMLDNPLNENLFWGQGEDVEHSLRVRDTWKYRMNVNSRVRLMKPKDLGILPLQCQ